MLEEQSTRSHILEATIALLKGGGESAVKVGLVAEELGIAAPSLYHHFANRSELIRSASCTRSFPVAGRSLRS